MSAMLIARLRIMAGMLSTGERIAFGSDAALLTEAADEVERLRELVRYVSAALCLDTDDDCDDVAKRMEMQSSDGLREWAKKASAALGSTTTV